MNKPANEPVPPPLPSSAGESRSLYIAGWVCYGAAMLFVALLCVIVTPNIGVPPEERVWGAIGFWIGSLVMVIMMLAFGWCGHLLRVQSRRLAPPRATSPEAAEPHPLD